MVYIGLHTSLRYCRHHDTLNTMMCDKCNKEGRDYLCWFREGTFEEFLFDNEHLQRLTKALAFMQVDYSGDFN